jgi:hypothetical protein
MALKENGSLWATGIQHSSGNGEMGINSTAQEIGHIPVQVLYSTDSVNHTPEPYGMDLTPSLKWKEDHTSAEIKAYTYDFDTPASSLTVFAKSDNNALFNIPNIGLAPTRTSFGDRVHYFQYTPTANRSGKARVTVYSYDDLFGGNSNKDSVQYTVYVCPQADDPSAEVDSIRIDEEAAATGHPSLLANDSDVDIEFYSDLDQYDEFACKAPKPALEVLSAAIATGKGPTQASHFVLNADGSYDYTHDGSESVLDSFTYVLSDGNSASSDV